MNSNQNKKIFCVIRENPWLKKLLFSPKSALLQTL